MIGPPRYSDKGGEVLGKFIPAGTTVACPTYTLHRDRKYLTLNFDCVNLTYLLTFSAHNFTDPEVFKPERWLSGSAEEPHNPDAFIPFSYGPGVCIGKPVALHNMK
jgi:cytochrome P450